MDLTKILRTLMNHPLNRRDRTGALVRFLRWQVGSRILGAPAAVPFAGKARLLVANGMTGATGNIYSGLHDLEEMSFTVHLLRPGDLFVDVGANVGVYTILATAVAGARAIAAEPVPTTFHRLLDNVRLNRVEERATCHNVGVGRASGVLRVTASSDTTNHVLGNGEACPDALEVPVRPVDELVGDEEPALIKIDTEGFETEVIAGGDRTFARPSLRAVLMELNGSGARYGFDEAALHRRMLALGFHPGRYDPFARAVTPAESGGGGPAGTGGTGGNMLYVRDFAASQERVATAEPIRIPGMAI